MGARRRGDQRNIVGRHDDRRAEAVERRQQVQDALRHFGIDVAGWLVSDQQLRPGDHGAGDGDTLLLAARQRWRASAGPVGETNPGQHLPHRAFDFRFRLAGDPQR